MFRYVLSMMMILCAGAWVMAAESHYTREPIDQTIIELQNAKIPLKERENLALAYLQHAGNEAFKSGDYDSWAACHLLRYEILRAQNQLKDLLRISNALNNNIDKMKSPFIKARILARGAFFSALLDGDPDKTHQMIDRALDYTGGITDQDLLLQKSVDQKTGREDLKLSYNNDIMLYVNLAIDTLFDQNRRKEQLDHLLSLAEEMEYEYGYVEAASHLVDQAMRLAKSISQDEVKLIEKNYWNFKYEEAKGLCNVIQTHVHHSNETCNLSIAILERARWLANYYGFPDILVSILEKEGILYSSRENWEKATECYSESLAFAATMEKMHYKIPSGIEKLVNMACDQNRPDWAIRIFPSLLKDLAAVPVERCFALVHLRKLYTECDSPQFRQTVTELNLPPASQLEEQIGELYSATVKELLDSIQGQEGYQAFNKYQKLYQLAILQEDYANAAKACLGKVRSYMNFPVQLKRCDEYIEDAYQYALLAGDEDILEQVRQVHHQAQLDRIEQYADLDKKYEQKQRVAVGLGLASPKPSVREQAIKMLAYSRDSEDGAVLMEHLETESDPLLQYQAAQSAVYADSSNLKKLLQDKRWAVRLGAAASASWAGPVHGEYCNWHYETISQQLETEDSAPMRAELANQMVRLGHPEYLKDLKYQAISKNLRAAYRALENLSNFSKQYNPHLVFVADALASDANATAFDIVYSLKTLSRLKAGNLAKRLTETGLKHRKNHLIQDTIVDSFIHSDHSNDAFFYMERIGIPDIRQEPQLASALLPLRLTYALPGEENKIRQTREMLKTTYKDENAPAVSRLLAADICRRGNNKDKEAIEFLRKCEESPLTDDTGTAQALSHLFGVPLAEKEEWAGLKYVTKQTKILSHTHGSNHVSKLTMTMSPQIDSSLDHAQLSLKLQEKKDLETKGGGIVGGLLDVQGEIEKGYAIGMPKMTLGGRTFDIANGSSITIPRECRGETMIHLDVPVTFFSARETFRFTFPWPAGKGLKFTGFEPDKVLADPTETDAFSVHFELSRCAGKVRLELLYSTASGGLEANDGDKDSHIQNSVQNGSWRIPVDDLKNGTYYVRGYSYETADDTIPTDIQITNKIIVERNPG